MKSAWEEAPQLKSPWLHMMIMSRKLSLLWHQGLTARVKPSRSLDGVRWTLWKQLGPQYVKALVNAIFCSIAGMYALGASSAIWIVHHFTSRICRTTLCTVAWIGISGSPEALTTDVIHLARRIHMCAFTHFGEGFLLLCKCFWDCNYTKYRIKKEMDYLCLMNYDGKFQLRSWLW